MQQPARSTSRALWRTGVLAVLVGVALDAWYHVGAGANGLTVPCCGLGFVGHLVTLAGMVLVLASIVATGLRSGRRRAAPPGRRSP